MLSIKRKLQTGQFTVADRATSCICTRNLRLKLACFPERSTQELDCSHALKQSVKGVFPSLLVRHGMYQHQVVLLLGKIKQKRHCFLSCRVCHSCCKSLRVFCLAFDCQSIGCSGTYLLPPVNSWSFSTCVVPSVSPQGSFSKPSLQPPWNPKPSNQPV